VYIERRLISHPSNQIAGGANPMASASSFAEDYLVDPQIQKRAPEQSAGKASQMTTETIKKKKILIQEDEWYVKQVMTQNYHI
jgi:hypothetical protein